MPVVPLSEANLRGGGSGAPQGRGRGEGSGGRDAGRGGASAGGQERHQAFQGRGNRLGGRQVTRPSFRHAVGNWLRNWRLRRNQSNRHASAERRTSGPHVPSAAVQLIRSHEVNCVETDSDEDTPPRQPTADLGPIRRAQVTARELGMNRRTPDTAPLTQSSAAAEASAKHAAPRARAPQRKETRQLGIKDSSLSDDGAQHASRINSDWMWGGDGAYVPSASSAVDMTLRLHETVKVFDMGLTAHPARAMLDSGNLSYTLISRRFAACLGLLDEYGWSKEDSIQTTNVLGVVAGASESLPLMKINYELRGRRMLITAGVSEALLGCDLLLSRREIAEFLSNGFTFDVR